MNRSNNVHALTINFFLSFFCKITSKMKNEMYKFTALCSVYVLIRHSFGSLTLYQLIHSILDTPLDTHKHRTTYIYLHNHKFLYQQIDIVMPRYVIIMIICSWYQLSLNVSAHAHIFIYSLEIECHEDVSIVSTQKTEDCYLLNAWKIPVKSHR